MDIEKRYEVCQDLHQKTLERFRCEIDEKDYWKSPNKVEDDGCGNTADLAIWERSRLHQLGIRLEDMWLALIPASSTRDYMVLLVDAGDGEYFVLNPMIKAVVCINFYEYTVFSGFKSWVRFNEVDAFRHHNDGRRVDQFDAKRLKKWAALLSIKGDRLRYA